MKKLPAIPSIQTDPTGVLGAIKENIEFIQGRRDSKIALLKGVASLNEVANKLNELIAHIQYGGEREEVAVSAISVEALELDGEDLSVRLQGLIEYASLRGIADRQIFVVPGAHQWTKPEGLSDTAVAHIEIWSAGSSGAAVDNSLTYYNAGGGAGGGYIDFWVPVALLNDIEQAIVGAGGLPASGNSNGNPGDNSSFTVRGRAFVMVGATSPTFAATAVAAGGADGGYPQGFLSATTSILMPWPNGAVGASYSGTHSAMGGRVTTADAPVAPGNSIYGGAGGGAASITAGGVRTGGTSVAAGDGGDGGDELGSNGKDGQAPAGGGGAAVNGGTSGAGARGEIRVTVFD